MFNSLFQPKKIRVKLIDSLSNDPFGEVKLSAGQLPASFDKPTTMHIEGEDWVVVRAEPVHAIEFIKEKMLTLWLKKTLKIDPGAIRFSIPTLPNALPPVSSAALFNEFSFTIGEDDWQQNEFLPMDLLPVVQEEMKEVEAILFPEGDPDFDSMNGFDRLHVRTKTGTGHLSIPVEEFITALGICQKGSLSIRDYEGYVKNGFAFRNDNQVYYGTIRENTITCLCVDYFDSIDSEFYNILSKYNLLFVSWCRGMITVG